MEDQSLYVWCLHCEKANLRVDVVKNQDCCTTPGCDGGGLGWDILTWNCDHWPRNNNLGYPEIPQTDVVYPLYG